MRNLKQFCITMLLALLFIIPSTVQGFEINNKTYSVISHQDLTCELSLVMEDIPELIIPSTVTYQGKEYKVTRIGPGAFRSTCTIGSISLPSSLVSIESYAFSGCHALSTINLPNSIERIGLSIFNDTPIYNDDNNWD